MAGSTSPHAGITQCGCCGRKLPSDSDRIETENHRIVCPVCYRGAAFPDAVQACPENWAD